MLSIDGDNVDRRTSSEKQLSDEIEAFIRGASHTVNRKEKTCRLNRRTSKVRRRAR